MPSKLIKYSDDEKKLLAEKSKILGIDATKVLLWSAIYPERIEKILEIKAKS